MSHYIKYYDAQVGNGGIEQVYAGSPFQRGHGGIGRFLGGLFRKTRPFLKRGAGMNIINDVLIEYPSKSHYVVEFMNLVII